MRNFRGKGLAGFAVPKYRPSHLAIYKRIPLHDAEDQSPYGCGVALCKAIQALTAFCGGSTPPWSELCFFFFTSVFFLLFFSLFSLSLQFINPSPSPKRNFSWLVCQSASLASLEIWVFLLILLSDYGNLAFLLKKYKSACRIYFLYMLKKTYWCINVKNY